MDVQQEGVPQQAHLLFLAVLPSKRLCDIDIDKIAKLWPPKERVEVK